MPKLKKEGYLNHLKRIKEKLKLYLNLYLDGHDIMTSDLSVKLRTLYMHKSGNKPLLKTIEELYGFRIYVHYLNIQQREPMPFFWFNYVADGWFENDFINMQPLFEVLRKEEKQIRIENIDFSYYDVIELYCDKMEGAHLDDKIPDELFNIVNSGIRINNRDMSKYVIHSVAFGTVEIINKIEEFLKTGNYNEYIRKSEFVVK